MTYATPDAAALAALVRSVLPDTQELYEHGYHGILLMGSGFLTHGDIDELARSREAPGSFYGLSKRSFQVASCARWDRSRPWHSHRVEFPSVTGRSLAGSDVHLPADFPAARTLALVAFQQRHQGCVDRWIARAEAAGVPGSPVDMAPGDDTCVVEIPVLSTRWKLGRGFIDGGMASSIRIPRVLARTITVYTNVSAFQTLLGIPGSEDVQACVVTPQGEVLARVPGEPTDAAWDVIAHALDN